MQLFGPKGQKMNNSLNSTKNVGNFGTTIAVIYIVYFSCQFFFQQFSQIIFADFLSDQREQLLHRSRRKDSYWEVI